LRTRTYLFATIFLFVLNATAQDEVNVRGDFFAPESTEETAPSKSKIIQGKSLSPEEKSRGEQMEKIVEKGQEDLLKQIPKKLPPASKEKTLDEKLDSSKNLVNKIKDVDSSSSTVQEQQQILEFYKGTLQKSSKPKIVGDPREQSIVAKKTETASETSLNPATLSLIVSAVPESHYRLTMQQLFQIQKEGKIKIGEIFVVGKNLDWMDEQIAQHNEETSKIKDAPKNSVPEFTLKRTRTDEYLSEHFSHTGLAEAPPLLKYLQISSSPTWVVRYNGQNHVYEGLQNPTDLFTSEGQYKEDKK
jgi:hypothetical protein